MGFGGGTMKRLLTLVAASALVMQFGSGILEACGAKFLVATRSAQRQRMVRTSRPATILLYQHNNSAGVVEDTTALRDLLKGVGHTVTIAAGEAALHDAAQSGGFNLVVMQLAEAQRLKTAVNASLPNAAILPVAVLASSSVSAAAKAEFGKVLIVPTKTSEILSTVESAYK